MPRNHDASRTPSGAWTGAGEAPEWTDEMFERADLYIGETLIHRASPAARAATTPVTLRLSSEVVARFRASGRGWHARLDAALREWLAQHPDF